MTRKKRRLDISSAVFRAMDDERIALDFMGIESDAVGALSAALGVDHVGILLGDPRCGDALAVLRATDPADQIVALATIDFIEAECP